MGALELTKSTVTSSERIKEDEESMNSMIDAAVLYANNSFEVNAEEEFARIHRIRRTPRRYDENAQEATVLDFRQYYRKEFKCVLDVLITQNREKMQSTLDVIAPIAGVLQNPLQEPSFENTQKLVEMFPSDVDAHVFQAEFEVFKNIVDDTPALKKQENKDVIEFAFMQRKTLPLTWKSYQLMLTSPISVAKDERTFSHLKFVKNVYRSTMGDKKLDNLMLLNCEKDLTDSLDMIDVVHQWSSAKQKR